MSKYLCSGYVVYLIAYARPIPTNIQQGETLRSGETLRTYTLPATYQHTLQHSYFKVEQTKRKKE